jgi:hypothetical protein
MQLEAYETLLPELVVPIRLFHGLLVWMTYREVYLLVMDSMG